MKLFKRFILGFFTALFLLSMSAPIFADGDGIPPPPPPPIPPGTE